VPKKGLELPSFRQLFWAQQNTTIYWIQQTCAVFNTVNRVNCLDALLFVYDGRGYQQCNPCPQSGHHAKRYEAVVKFSSFFVLTCSILDLRRRFDYQVWGAATILEKCAGSDASPVSVCWRG